MERKAITGNDTSHLNNARVSYESTFLSRKSWGQTATQILCPTHGGNHSRTTGRKESRLFRTHAQLPTFTVFAAACVFQGVRAVVEWARHGVDTPIFISSTVLCIAWAFASVLRSRDHWREAAKPPMVGAGGLPARRRLWWALWPFFNLSFITAVSAFVENVHHGKRWSGFISAVADDKLWNLSAMAIALVLVSYSVLSGAEVTLCTRKPNAEFTAGFLSSGLFSWFSDVIDVGQTKQLDLDDLPTQAC